MIERTEIEGEFARRLKLRQKLSEVRHDATATSAARRLESELVVAEAKIGHAEQERMQAFEIQPAAPIWSIQR